MTRREWLMAGLLLLLALLSLLVPRCADAETSWPQDRAFIFYNSGLSSDLLDSLAATFTFAIGSGDGDGSDIDSLLARGSKFEWYAKYNSATDNYVPSSEHTYLSNADTLAAYGVDNVEAFYLHWIEDTIYYIEGELDTISGWNPDNVIDPATGSPYVASAASEDEARVKAFYNSGTRRAVNFSDANARDMMIGFNAVELLTTTPGGVEPRGLFLDNAGALVFGVNGYAGPDGYSGPVILSGGGIAEATNNAVLNSQEFRDWYKETGSPYFQDLKTFLDTHVDDIFGGVQRYSMPNVANTYVWDRNRWEAMFITPPYFAHMPLLEFVYSPWTHWPTSQPGTIHAKQKDAINAGIGIFESGIIKASSYPYTREDEIEAQIAGYLVHRPYIGAVTDPLQKTWFLGVNNWNPGDNDSDGQPNFSTVLTPLYNIDLGLPLGDPYELVTGIWARRYELGMAVVRHSVDGDAKVGGVITLEDPITFQLPPTYVDWVPLDKDMNQGTAVTTWTLGEGMGKVFLNGSSAATGFYGYLELTAPTFTGTHTDMVIPFKCATSDLQQARSDFYDVRFKTEAGANIDFVYGEVSGDSITFWLRPGSISSGDKIRVWTGDTTLIDDPSQPLIWDDYYLVLHGEENPWKYDWFNIPAKDESPTDLYVIYDAHASYPWLPEYSVQGVFGRGIYNDAYRGTTSGDIEVRGNWALSLWAKARMPWCCDDQGEIRNSGTDVVIQGQPNWWYLAINAQSGNRVPAGTVRYLNLDGGPTNNDTLAFNWLGHTNQDGVWARYDFVFTETPDTSLSCYVNGELLTPDWYINGTRVPGYEFGVDIDLLGKNTNGPFYETFGIGSQSEVRSGDQRDNFNGTWDEIRLLTSFTPDADFIATQYAAEADPVGWFDWNAADYVVPGGTSVIPVITRVDGYRNVEGEQVTLTGTNFGTAGGSVMLGDSGTYANAAPLITQSIQSWSDTEIVLNYTPGSYGIATPVYLFVIHSNGEVSNGIFVPRRPGSKLPPDVGGE